MSVLGFILKTMLVHSYFVVFYITTIYSPCPEGKFHYSKNGLQKWCEIKNKKGEILKHGPWISLFADQLIKERGEYAMGKKNGHWVYWYPNNAKKAEGDMDNGKKIDRWTYWNEEGEEIPSLSK